MRSGVTSKSVNASSLAGSTDRFVSSDRERPSHASSTPVKYSKMMPPDDGYAMVLQVEGKNSVRGISVVATTAHWRSWYDKHRMIWPRQLMIDSIVIIEIMLV